MAQEQESKRKFWLAGRREEGQDRFFKEALDPAIWQEGDAENWDACWYTGMPKNLVYKRLEAGNWVNHIPGNNALTIKSRLAETLTMTRERVVAEHGADSDFARRASFYPDTFPMPQSYHALQHAAHENPHVRWILKPKNSARGQDISLVRDVAAVPNDPKWIIQRYLDNPHLMHGHKYVLRLYALITSVDPLRAYLYHEGFAKLASEAYDLNTPFNVFSHLTNPDINATNTDSETPVVFIPLADYGKWLREGGHDEEKLFAKLRDLVAITMISARDHMIARTADLGDARSGCYEIIGLDCLVDADLEPWILECNLSPSLDICAAPEDGGIREHEIKSQLVKDMVAMLRFNDLTPPAEPDADPRERVLREADAENGRSNGWRRLVPSEDPEALLPFFALPRLADMVLADASKGQPLSRPGFALARGTEIVAEDALSIFAESTGRLYQLNEMAAFIWLHAIDGDDADAIADRIVAMHGDIDEQARWDLRATVWAQLGEWVEMGLLRKVFAPEQPLSAAARPLRRPHAYLSDNPPPEPDRQSAFALTIAGRELRIASRIPMLHKRISEWPGCRPATEGAAEDVIRISIHRAKAGYSVVIDDVVEANAIGAGSIAPLIYHTMLTRALHGEALAAALACPVVRYQDRTGATRHALIAAPSAAHWDMMALDLAEALGGRASFGLALEGAGDAETTALGLPLRISEDDAQTLRERDDPRLRDGIGAQVQLWPGNGRGHLIDATDGSAGSKITIDTIILPSADEELSGDLPVERAGVDAALARLLHHLHLREDAYGHAEGERAYQVGRLSGWLEGRMILRVSQEAIGAIGQALRRDQADQAAVETADA